MTWLEQAEILTDGAKRASEAGDHVAFIILATRAAECVQIAKLLNSNDENGNESDG